MKILKNILWYLKQLIPRKHWVKYDTSNSCFDTIRIVWKTWLWKQWFISVDTYIEPPKYHSYCRCQLILLEK